MVQRCGTHRTARWVDAGVVILALGVACSKEPGPMELTSPVSIEVASPIGSRMAAGRTVLLTATAKDARNSVMSGVTFKWSSSAASVASVDLTGLVTGLAAGDARISAAAGNTSGGADLRVINARLDEINPTLNDPFTLTLVANLTSDVRGRVQAALAQCRDGAGQGNFTTIETCLATARTEVANASDATDRALLASLALFFDHIQRLLNV